MSFLLQLNRLEEFAIWFCGLLKSFGMCQKVRNLLCIYFHNRLIKFNFTLITIDEIAAQEKRWFVISSNICVHLFREWEFWHSGKQHPINVINFTKWSSLKVGRPWTINHFFAVSVSHKRVSRLASAQRVYSLVAGWLATLRKRLCRARARTKHYRRCRSKRERESTQLSRPGIFRSRERKNYSQVQKSQLLHIPESFTEAGLDPGDLLNCLSAEKNPLERKARSRSIRGN